MSAGHFTLTLLRAQGSPRLVSALSSVQEQSLDLSPTPWPAGQEMLCYMLAHEAHQRGQVCLLAHQLGFPLPRQVAYGLWNWEKLLKG